MSYSNRRESILVAGITVVVIAGILLVLTRKSAPEEEVKKPPQTTTPSTPETKLYRNEEFGFEFEYPENWTFEVNSFYSPFSKFNLQGDSSATDYNSLLPPFLLNVVTPDFADRAVLSIRALGATESEVVAGGVQGRKLEYEEQHGSYKVSSITIVLPLGPYKIILGAHKEYEDVFNQILASFKFSR